MISAGVDGELSEEDSAALHAHLDACPDCRRVYDAFQCIGDAVRDDLVEPPELLAKGVMHKVRSMERGDSPRRFAFGKFTALAACLAVVLFAAGQFGLFGGSNSAPAAGESAKSASNSVDTSNYSNDSLSVPEVALEGLYDGSDMTFPENDEETLCTLGESMAPAVAPEESHFAIVSENGVDVTKAFSLPLEELERPFPAAVTKVAIYKGGDLTASPLLESGKAEVIYLLCDDLAMRLEVSLDDIPEEEPLYTVAYTLSNQDMLARIYSVGNHMYCLITTRELAEAQARQLEGKALLSDAELIVPKTELIDGEKIFRHIFYLAYGDADALTSYMDDLLIKQAGK